MNEWINQSKNQAISGRIDEAMKEWQMFGFPANVLVKRRRLKKKHVCKYFCVCLAESNTSQITKYMDDLPLNKRKEGWGISGLSESAAMKNDHM